MNIRKLIREEIGRTLASQKYKGYAAIPVPRDFDHLKWNLSVNQKYYLKDLCDVDPDSLKESDFKNAEKFLGIPKNNIKSIINTYTAFDPMEDAVFEGAADSPFKLGNKPVIVSDVMGVEDLNRQPTKSNRTTFPVLNTSSPVERKTMDYAIKKNRVLDRSENSSQKEKFYESVHTSLMTYLFCELKPKDIKLNYKNQIQIDQEPVLLEGENFSSENHTYRRVNDLLKSFNKIFNTSFRIADHIDLSEIKKCHRTFVEHMGFSEDKMFWSKDRKSWSKPGDVDYERLKEQYIQMQGQQTAMPEIPRVDHKEMLKKYFNGDLITYNPNSEWI